MQGKEKLLFSILGDSISTLEGYSEPQDAAFYDLPRKIASGVLRYEDTWWGSVINALEGRLLVNNSISGSTVCWHRLYEVPSYGCSRERTSALGRNGLAPNVILVFMGTNDWGCGTQIRTNVPCHSHGDSALFAPAYRMMLERLKQSYPRAELQCFTLPVSRCSANEQFTFPYYHGGRHHSEYCQAIRECAEEMGCGLVDLNRVSEPYDTIDGFHPNANGMRTIAEAVLKELQKNGIGKEGIK